MDELLLFVPKSERDADANLRDFIDFARSKLTTFGADLDFESDKWKVTEHANVKARNTEIYLRFTSFGSAKNLMDGPPMQEPFKSFAKAFYRHLHAFSAAKVANHTMFALRSLLQALQESLAIPTPALATPHHFQRAAQILAERYKRPAYSRLAHISAFLAEYRLVSMPFVWCNPLPGAATTQTRVGPEFDVLRKSKLPSPESISAIAEIFSIAKDPSDIFVTSACAILCSAPSRANEMLHLPVHCEEHTKDSAGQKVYGLRWRPSKGGDALIKWVVPSMVSVVRDAVAKLRKLSKDARAVARWYETNPSNLYLPVHLEHLRNKPRLTFREVSEIVFRDASRAAKPEQRGSRWCRGQNIKSDWESGSRKITDCKTVRYADVERAVLALLPPGFPVADKETGLLYSEALCLALRNQMSSESGTYRSAIVLVDYGVVQSRLAGNANMKSIFEKFGYKDDSGIQLRLSTHQFRHYLNTLAQMGGLSQLDIAKWSGRTKVAQNAVYNHQSDRDVLAMVRAAIGDENKMFGSLAHSPKNVLITRDRFATLKVLTAHTTDLGYCIHDFSMLPCQIHRDCINCDEHLCVKGDQVQERAIRLHRSETNTLLAVAKEALGEDEFGATKWVDHQSLTLQRLNQLCAILDDPTVPDGTIIQPAGVTSASRLEQARLQAEQTSLRIASPNSTEDPS